MKKQPLKQQKNIPQEIREDLKKFPEASGQTSESAPELPSQSDPLAEPAKDKAAPADGTPSESGKVPARSSRHARRVRTPPLVPVHRWFVTFMCMNIPIIGWFYLIILAFSPSKGPRRDFAKAYLIYKLVFLLISLAILAVAFHYGMELLDQVLAYMEML